MNSSFQEELRNELNRFLSNEKTKFPDDEILKIDMHCHDYNSDVPDELMGRILNVPETWLKTESLIETLNRNQVDVITITNHNNARSCFDLINQGKDILVGTEFSCTVPDFSVGIHVLTYGFTKEQERVLNKLRGDVYKFQRYALANDIPTVWAHPLYHYKADGGVPNMDFFNKMGLIFERFEVLNGQRDTWQNLLVKFWLDDFTPEKIDAYCEQFNINPKLYCSNPYKKSFVGGSDSHMGIFSGQTGTLLHVPNLKERLKTTKPSVLALEAIREGNTAPYGNHQNSEKLTIAFLDYVCQLAMYKKDPGLMRILLHKGTVTEKVQALLLSNAFSELQQHKITMRFIDLFHRCFTGKSPSMAQRLFVPRLYKPVFDDAFKIGQAKFLPAEEMVTSINHHVNSIFNRLNVIFFDRLNAKVDKLRKKGTFDKLDLNDFIEKLEIPSDFRALMGGEDKSKRKSKERMVTPNLSAFLDGLSFPFLASNIILGANFTSAKVMYNNRGLLKTFSENIGKLHHPERLLWLTDTFEDKNGVSMFLQDVHREIKRRNLPIDILVCSSTLQSDDHLIVVKPMAEYQLPFGDNQTLRIPNFIEIHNLFLERSFSQIVCSTEGVMGLVSLYLKNTYSVKASFYMHTDWLMFARKVLKLDKHNLNRVRRFLRAYYKAFDDLFVLNTDHQAWLTGSSMGIEPANVHLTAHWVDEIFKPHAPNKAEVFGVDNWDKVLLFAGRLSPEKGVMDLQVIYEQLKVSIPNLRLVFAGTGPAEADLKKAIPDAVFLGWVNHSQLPKIYSSADLLVMPSKFDTFSCVVLEALSCGLPVVAYNSKGPKDIIVDSKCGYLVNTKTEMMLKIEAFFGNDDDHFQFKQDAILRARNYHAEGILNQFCNDLELPIQQIHQHVEA